MKLIHRDEKGDINPSNMVGVIVVLFVLVVLAYAFTYPLTNQVNTWKTNLTAQGQFNGLLVHRDPTAAATVVGLVPTILWILVAIAMILLPVYAFGIGGHRKGGL